MWTADTWPAVPTGWHAGLDEAASTPSGAPNVQVNTERRRLSVPVDSGLAAGSDSSPVLAEWFIGWDESFGRRDPDGLWGYAQRLVGSRGTTDQEVVRQWLVIDWLIRRAVTTWLSAAGLADHAEHLHAGRPVMDRRTLTDIAEPVRGATRAAQTAHEQAWSAVARLAQPDLDQSDRRPPWRPVPGNTDPRRVKAWGGLADGTRAAVPSLGRLVGPRIAPECRVVYVDYDPIVMAHAHALVNGTPEGATAYVLAVMREVETVMYEAAATLDFAQPVAVLFVSMLHFLGDAEDPHGLVGRYLRGVASGSFLAVSHMAADIQPEAIAALAETTAENDSIDYAFHPRRRTEVARFFERLELVEPGVVPIEQWRPDEPPPRPPAGGGEPPFHAGIGRKP